MSTPDICLSRHRGNAQSSEANERVHSRKPCQRDLLLRYIKGCGAFGSTCEQAANALGMRYTSASARIAEMKALGLITESQTRRPTTGGDSAAVLIISAPREPKQLSFT